VSSTQFDHTSVIASVLRQHELDPLNVRDDGANDVWGLLDEQLLLDGTPLPPIELQPIDVDEDALNAPECNGLGGIGLHGSLPGTGQPELEAFANAHPSPLDGRLDQEATFAKILAHARDLGVLR
jgi:hypothetical protein